MEKINKRLIGMFVLCMCWAGIPCLSQNTKGLHFTIAELAIWKTRSVSGPYKTAGDVRLNSPGDWTRIVNQANSFLANPVQAFWTGTPAGTPITSAAGSSIEPVKEGNGIRDAAFYYLITGDLKFGNAVKAQLLKQAKEPLTDFSNLTRFPDNEMKDSNPGFFIADWVTKLIYTYDYTKDLYSDSEKAIILAWFKNAAYWSKRNIDAGFDLVFENRYSTNIDTQNYTLTGYAKVVNFGKLAAFSHKGGWQIPTSAYYYNNRKATHIRMVAATSILIKDEVLKETAKRWFKEWLIYGVNKDGIVGEMERWSKDFPDLGFGYSALMVALMTDIADMYARDGDVTLYTYQTSRGQFTSEGGSKSLHLVIKNLLYHLDGTVKREAPESNYSNCLIDGLFPEKNWNTVADIYFSQANIYLKDNYIKGNYTRTGPGTKPYPSKLASMGPWHPWSGAWGAHPGSLFMFGQMEGKVWPYSVIAKAPNQNPIVSTGADKSITLPVNNLKITGIASDKDGTISSYSWTKQSGAAATLSNATTAELTLTNLLEGNYVFRLTVKDNFGASSYDEVSVAVVPSASVNTEKVFYRGINLNGPSVTIDGKTWEASAAAANFSFTGRAFENQAIPLVPATDADKSAMLRSSIWKTSGTDSVTATLNSVPNGKYQIYLYVWEDNASAIFDVYLQSNLKINDFSSGTKGSWNKLDLGEVVVSNGNIKIKAMGGDACLSGLEVHKITEDVFYKGININGAATTIDGNSWESGINSATFSFSGRVYENQSVNLIPTTDVNRSAMLRSVIYRNAISDSVTATLINVPNGFYEVFLYVWEDNTSTTYDVFLEGVLKVNDYVSGTAGKWTKLNLGRVEINDENIKIKAKGGDACLSGIEIWKVSSLTAPNTASASKIERDEVVSLTNLIAFPNPFNEEIHLKLEDTQDKESLVDVKIMGLNGKLFKTESLVLKTRESDLLISGVDHLPSGLYILKASSGTWSKTFKMIKR